jgi:SagB-type dehydrogenase family enzyme
MLKKTEAYKFLKQTSFSLKNLQLRQYRVEPAPPFKEYPLQPKIRLSVGKIEEFSDLFNVLLKRRSSREYTKYPISLREVALLCWATQGITGKAGPYLLRTAPSAGALYPIETYLAVNFSSDLPPGIYHLEVKDFTLALLKEGYVGDILSELALGQTFFSTASVVFIWSAVFRRTISKYGDRGLRYIFMDVAHICENLLLACEALGLKACPVGAFFDEELNEFLQLDGEEESVIYTATVGK